MKSFRIGVIAVVLVSLTLSVGVAAADVDAPNLNNRSDSKPTHDGWVLKVSLADMNITSVPNMAATAFTREAFVSATATVENLAPAGKPPASEVPKRTISLWMQLGCQVDLGALTLTGSNTSQVGISSTANNAGAVSVTPNASDNPNPQLALPVSPGTIKEKNLLNKAYPPADSTKPDAPKPPAADANALIVSLRMWDMKVEACGGPVSARFHAEAQEESSHSTDSVDAYSDIVQI